ncbi:inorganic diphosphatase [Sphingobacteriales bacterium UPWRP_1]|nr:inorganic pyrophosphatase [Sphingobacteriales bacterium TSM_CSS]PSJ75764.1 inorganic diphosphatase [Sphingobacteriales bacterium UPWRP_1]
MNLFKAHPWHGISAGKDVPQIVTAFIEIVPADTVKYEIDKESGWLKVDRPQKYSNIVPALYGFVPQTYCGNEIARYCRQQTGRADVVRGDGDPLDICVLAERVIPHGGIILRCIPIGGFRLIDKGEADDKIIAVLEGDDLYGQFTDIDQCPKPVIERLRHYFLTYKTLPGEPHTCQITHLYNRAEAHEVIQHSLHDYQNTFIAGTDKM